MTRKKSDYFYLLSIIILFPFVINSQVTKEEEALLFMTELVESVEKDSLSVMLPPELEEMVNQWYCDTIISDDIPLKVLSKLTSIYSEHGYHETGSWEAKGSYQQFFYKPENLPEYNEEDFQLPVDGYLTSGYGYRPKFGRFHKGIDVAINPGDTVKSVLPGIVSKTGYEPGGYGRYVVVAHTGGMETLYGHLLTYIVKPGKTVEAGEAIGLGGATGNATGPHLHFETRYRGIAVNPLYLWPNN